MATALCYSGCSLLSDSSRGVGSLVSYQHQRSPCLTDKSSLVSCRRVDYFKGRRCGLSSVKAKGSDREETDIDDLQVGNLQESGQNYQTRAMEQAKVEWSSQHVMQPEQGGKAMTAVVATGDGENGDERQEVASMAARVLYSLAMYGGMATFGKLICDIAGVDFLGGLRLDAEDFYLSLLCALPPIFVSLVLRQDPLVESWEAARAIRDAEDEELSEFFLGMAPWQYFLIAFVATVAEELFFRSAVQGGLAHTLQMSSKGSPDLPPAIGVSALTSMIHTFSPCAQACAAVLTAAITGSMFYIISTPKDPQIIVARGWSKEMRQRLEVWHERQQLKKIYSPLLESLLSFYLALEWICTGNLLAPAVTHALYYMSMVSIGVRRLEETRVRSGSAKRGALTGRGRGVPSTSTDWVKRDFTKKKD
eukprot:TRINITY_DN493_c0_g3_i2.p1 TRINITY_DN493_c0_g3~~TRINITY_DN493_c0_g3_i2.p1  ORF type:complete len:421 (+),score=61.44 TRINITY_DN493_c0_g3_i2:308-1570(+)